MLAELPPSESGSAPDHYVAREPGRHIGQIAGARLAIEAATAGYLRGDALDMKALAAELGVGRATLYRWVHGREELLAIVLAESTARTFAQAEEQGKGTGAELVVQVCELFMRGAVEAEPLRILTAREPLLFIRLATTPGAIERESAHGIQRILDREVKAGTMTIAAPAPILAEAIVRICDSHVYAHLLGRPEAEIDTAVMLIRLLLRP